VTAWSDEQWATFCALMSEWWPGEFGEGARGAWRIALDSVMPAEAFAAGKRLLLTGQRFRPSAAEFLFAVRQDPGKPTFDEALKMMTQAVVHNSEERYVLESIGHPFVAAFLERYGVRRFGTLPLYDPEWGPKHHRDLEAAWDRHVEAFDGREIAAIAAGSGDLRQLDPLASLQIGRGDADGARCTGFLSGEDGK
jgi:hypothetical protein